MDSACVVCLSIVVGGSRAITSCGVRPGWIFLGSFYVTLPPEHLREAELTRSIYEKHLPCFHVLTVRAAATQDKGFSKSFW
uniref:Putative secreted protein n=1 Tax=Anopheles marajoara TaxID=58244 RepID=A0A2M4CBS4_9DIPT